MNNFKANNFCMFTFNTAPWEMTVSAHTEGHAKSKGV